MSLTPKQVAERISPAEMVALNEVVLKKYKAQRFDVLSLVRSPDGRVSAHIELENGGKRLVSFSRSGK